MLTFEEWRHTYADVFETDDAARAAWTAASNKGYSAGTQDTRELLAAHSAGAQGVLHTPQGWRLVPCVPTAEMVNAACPAGECIDHFDMKLAILAAMKAAPVCGKPQCEVVSKDTSDALQDSAYCAGLQAGFSFGQLDDNERLRKALESRDGYVKVLREQRAAHPQPMPQTNAARELIEAAKDVLANGHQHDVGGGDVFLGTCDSTERLQRALAEIERLDRAKGE
ncbi:hypothetical protein [Trinickia soli]|nr:hypothetical protein [Trinickia soli]CAB3644426.1 hypothetical protein LMG24076_00490 [Trinickia soli]